MDFPRQQGIVPTREFGSVGNAPKLPEGFADAFASYRIDTGGLHLHAVVGGSGEPLLLLAEWPQNWFVWRYLMLPLSRRFTVIAVDRRGVGLSDKPANGYDADTLAEDIFALMDALGYERFRMVGHDISAWVGFVMGTSRPDRIEQLAIGEAIIPGLSASPPLLSEDRRTSDFLWHFNFNRALDVYERLVEGREDIYLGYQFVTKAGSPEALPGYERDFYIELLRRAHGALRASFDYYRAIDDSIPQYRRWQKIGLSMSVLAFAGALACGDLVEREISPLSADFNSIIIPDSGHYPAEEQPEAMHAALQKFFGGK